jgi:hypothetical protein
MKASEHKPQNTSTHYTLIQPYMMADTAIPDAPAKFETRDKNVPSYKRDIGTKLGDSARELLEDYSKIPAAEVEEHVYKIVWFPVTSIRIQELAAYNR